MKLTYQSPFIALTLLGVTNLVFANDLLDLVITPNDAKAPFSLDIAEKKETPSLLRLAVNEELPIHADSLPFRAEKKIKSEQDDSKTDTDSVSEISQPNVLTKTFTFKELNWQDLRLQGAKASLNFYLVQPKQIQYKGGKLNLQLTQSPLLKENSSLTFLLNNNRLLSSLALKPGNTSLIPWDIDLPATELANDWVSFGLTAHWDAELCKDYDDPANWVFISPDSRLSLQYKKMDFVPDLASLPYPFNYSNFLDKSENLLVLPETLSIKTMAPALMVARKMGMDANNNPIQLKVISSSNLSESQKQNSNFIYIGTKSDISTIQNTIMPLIEKEMQNRLETIPSDAGIINLMASPDNPFHALLTLTGENEQALKKATEGFSQPDFTKMFYGKLAFIRDEPKLFRDSRIQKGPFTLKSIGFDDQTTIGLGQGTLSYNFNLPADKAIDELVVNTFFSHSAFTPKDRSTLTLSVNGIRQGSVILVPENGENSSWPLSVKGDVLNPGPNTLSYTFDLHIPREGCASRYDFQSWGVIRAGTTLEAIFTTKPKVISINRFPLAFDKHTLIVLPKTFDTKEATAIVNFFVKLGVLFNENSLHFEVVSADEVNEAKLQQNNLILIGTIDTNPLIKQSLLKAPLRLEGDKFVLYQDNNKQNLLNKNALGVVELIDSPWNPALSALIIGGMMKEDYTTTLNLFADPSQFAKFTGNIATLMQDGTVASFETRQLPQIESSKDKVKKDSLLTKLKSEEYRKELLHQAYANLGLIVILVFLVIAIVLALIGFFIRRKRDKS